MLYRVIGAAGSGKTERMYTELISAYRNGKSCVWIAPEQQSVQYEREILTRLGDGCNLSVEILNFERLPERIAREYGDLAVTYPDKGALCALLSVLACEHKKELKEYAASAEDAAFAADLLGLFGRLRSENIRPAALRDAAARVGDAERLQAKLSDIATLFEAYDAYFDETRRDERDALSRLADELNRKPFFAGKTVFVDGYYTFTGQEYALLAKIMKQADAVYCSFTYDGREVFENNAACAFRLAKAADRVTDLPVGTYKRSRSDELRFLEAHLWETDMPTFTGNTGDVRIVTAENAFLEAEAVAREILRLEKRGFRRREITVLARNVESCEDLLHAVLTAQGIPFFMANKDELLSRPLAAFVCAAAELVTTDFSLSAVRKYLKSGYAETDAEDSDLLLRYAESWSLCGRQWTENKPFLRNPDGYIDGGMTEEQELTLQEVNRARELFLQSTLPLRTELRAARTGREILSALYRHLERVGAPERYTEKLNRLQNSGDTEQAARESGLWEVLMRIFERLDELCGEKPVTVKRMLSLFRLTAAQYRLGAIPQSQDSVTVGDASLTRPDRAKAVILMGCNDGVFPAAVGSDPLFDETEAIALEGAGLAVSEPRFARMTAERFYFYSAVASPSETLILTYPTGSMNGEELRPSPAVERIRTLLPHVKTESYTGTGSDALFSARNAAAVFHTLPEGDERGKLRTLLEECGETVPPLRGRMTEPTAKIDYRGEYLRISPSAIERYRYCPFSYFGGYVLKLKEKKKNRFATPEIGTFIHAILEHFLRSHTHGGKFYPPADDAELERETDELMRICISDLCGGSTEQTERFRHTCRNLKKTLLLLLRNLSDEFENSAFFPAGFEVGIGMGNDSALPAVEFVTESGKRVYLCGSIDRVDHCVRDGVTYVRVVDYKTYSKTFREDYVRDYGLDEQMLLYLFAYCKLNASDGELFLPAGVLYSTATLPFAETTGTETDAEIQTKIDEKLERTGVILENTDIALAMDRSASGKYLPVKFDRDGMLKKGRGTLSAEGFAELERLLETQLLELADGIFGGNMDVRPIAPDPMHDACHYCKFHAACRYSAETEGED